MIHLSPSEVSPNVWALIPPDQPARFRLNGVIDGVIPADIYVNDAQNPSCVVVRELLYGTFYLGGDVDWAWLSEYILELRPYGEFLLGVWDNEAAALKAKLPPLDYEGAVIDYTDRAGVDLLELMATVPEGCTLRQVDETLFDQLNDRDGILSTFGSKENALATTYGSCLLVGGELVSEAFGSAPVRGIIEAGVSTHPDHRRKGYGTLTSAHLIHLCESAGYPTYWNTNAANLPSVALAKKLGYQTARPYTLFGWFVTD